MTDLRAKLKKIVAIQKEQEFVIQINMLEKQHENLFEAIHSNPSLLKEYQEKIKKIAIDYLNKETNEEVDPYFTSSPTLVVFLSEKTKKELFYRSVENNPYGAYLLTLNNNELKKETNYEIINALVGQLNNFTRAIEYRSELDKPYFYLEKDTDYLAWFKTTFKNKLSKEEYAFGLYHVLINTSVNCVDINQALLLDKLNLVNVEKKYKIDRSYLNQLEPITLLNNLKTELNFEQWNDKLKTDLEEKIMNVDKNPKPYSYYLTDMLQDFKKNVFSHLKQVGIQEVNEEEIVIKKSTKTKKLK